MTLLLGDVIEPDDEHWVHYLDLLTIMDYIFAPDTHRQLIFGILCTVQVIKKFPLCNCNTNFCHCMTYRSE